MTKIKFKSFTVNKNSSIIKFEHEDAHDSSSISDEIRAISILLGEHDGNINQKTISQLRHRFQSAIDDVIIMMR